MCISFVAAWSFPQRSDLSVTPASDKRAARYRLAFRLGEDHTRHHALDLEAHVFKNPTVHAPRANPPGEILGRICHRVCGTKHYFLSLNNGCASDNEPFPGNHRHVSEGRNRIVK